MLVSHRFSMVQMADLIVVLNGGRVVELGRLDATHLGTNVAFTKRNVCEQGATLDEEVAQERTMAALRILTVAPQREIGCCRQRGQQPHQSLCGG